MKAEPYKPPLNVVRQEAWELATLLVEQADFAKEDMVFARSTDRGILNQKHGDQLLRYVLRGLVSLGIDTRIPNQGQLWAPLFIRVANVGPGDTVEVVFNPCRHPELGALKQNIILLRRQEEFTAESLTETMKRVNPSVRYDLTLKELPEAILSPA